MVAVPALQRAEHRLAEREQRLPVHEVEQQRVRADVEVADDALAGRPGAGEAEGVARLGDGLA